MAINTHFHHSDPRFCGSAETFRAFALDDNGVTCPACKSNDRLEITDRGRLTLAESELGNLKQQRDDLLAALEDEREWLLDQIDGATECRGRDSAISARIQAIGIAIRKARGE